MKQKHAKVPVMPCAVRVRRGIAIAPEVGMLVSGAPAAWASSGDLCDLYPAPPDCTIPQSRAGQTEGQSQARVQNGPDAVKGPLGLVADNSDHARPGGASVTWITWAPNDRPTGQKGSQMTAAVVEDILRPTISDAELEAAAAEMALSYTYQTSAYNRCCN